MRLFGKEVEVVHYHYDTKWGITGIVMLSLMAILISVNMWNGFVGRQREIDDQNKSQVLNQVVQALDLYYRDSSDFLENRAYPVAKCSNDLNSFDYEYTLRGALTGVRSASRSHSYIVPNQFPTDTQGSYTQRFPSSFSCRTVLPQLEQQQSGYFNGTTICNFEINTSKNCFLYTSSLTGDSYKLAYWSPFYNKYVVYSKFRTEDLSVRLF